MSGVVGSAGKVSGVIDLISQNIALSSGKGIDFSATANSAGTMSSEVFTDYETGDWTPTLTNISGSVSYTWNKGTYTKIGRHVFCIGYIQLTGSSNSPGSGTIQVTGFPYTSFSQSGYQSGGGVVMWHNVFSSGPAPQVMNMSANATKATCYRYSTGHVLSSADASSMTNSSQFGFTVNYRSAS